MASLVTVLARVCSDFFASSSCCLISWALSLFKDYRLDLSYSWGGMPWLGAGGIGRRPQRADGHRCPAPLDQGLLGRGVPLRLLAGLASVRGRGPVALRLVVATAALLVSRRTLPCRSGCNSCRGKCVQICLKQPCLSQAKWLRIGHFGSCGCG